MFFEQNSNFSLHLYEFIFQAFQAQENAKQIIYTNAKKISNS